MMIPESEKPVSGTVIRPSLIEAFDPEKKVMIPSYEDLAVTVHGKSPKGDWIYRVRKEEGVWRSIRPSDREGGLIVFVHEDPPPVYEYVSQNKKLLLRVVKVLQNAAVGVLFLSN
jgi:hypothetical protein